MRPLATVLEDVIRVAVEYYELTGKPLGVTGEIAECHAAALLGLELAQARHAGFDATRPVAGGFERIQIKGRWKRTGKNWGRVPSININKEFDVVMLVLMHANYEVFQILEAPRAAVIARLVAPGSRARNERFSMEVSQFKSIAAKIWPA